MWDSLEENEACEFTHLYFSNTNMDDAGLKKMLSRWDNMPKLEHLELHNNKLTDSSVKVC